MRREARREGHREPHRAAVTRADFTDIRYAQAWEDADVLLAGLDVRPGDVCVSIASAGDNTLALLTRQPSRVIALDLSGAQLACLELRIAAYRTLTHDGLLELVGSRPSTRRTRGAGRPWAPAPARSGTADRGRSTPASVAWGDSRSTSPSFAAPCCRSCIGAARFSISCGSKPRTRATSSMTRVGTRGDGA